MRSPHASVGLVATMAALGTASLLGCYRTNGRAEADVGPPPPDAFAPRRADAFSARPDAVSIAPDARTPTDECARDADCGGVALCTQNLGLAPVDLASVPLRCGVPIGVSSPGTECDANLECAHGMCALAGGCVNACLEDSDCAADERCTRVPVVTSPSTLQFARGCVRWVDAPPGVTVRASDEISLARFSTERLTVEPLVSPTRLVLHVADEPDFNRFFSRVETTTGEVAFDAFELGISRQDLVVTPFYDTLPILIPNGDRDFAPGTGFVASLETGETTRLHRVVMDRATRGSVLDINVFYVGVDTAGGAVPTRPVRQLLEEFGTMLSTVGLGIGRTRHLIVPGATAITFSVIESEEEVGDMFTYSAGAARPALNLFLIRSGFDFLGIAGGAPGAMLVHGTRGSGIAIGLDDLVSILPMSPAGQMGTVASHELGHFSGLFHTTEFDGSILEPLSDTPECDLATYDLDRDGFLLPEECEGAGADNVMFWGPFVASPRFSARQTRILENAMVLR